MFASITMLISVGKVTPSVIVVLFAMATRAIDVNVMVPQVLFDP